MDRTLVYGSALMDRHLAYVALTRHRDDAVLYASREVFGMVADLARRFSRDGSASTTLSAQPRGYGALFARTAS